MKHWSIYLVTIFRSPYKVQKWDSPIKQKALPIKEGLLKNVSNNLNGYFTSSN